MVKIKAGEYNYYMDDFLKNQLDKTVVKVKMKDEDRFFIVDGREGAGKSVLVHQLAKHCDPTYNLSRCVFTAEDFEKAIINAGKGQAVVFDEAFRGLSSRASLSQMNKLLVQLMMECRQKNLIVFIVMPTFFLLERYVAIHRATGLFHVYRGKGGQRGRWMYFNWQNKKKLYMNGIKKFWSYDWPKSNFKGRFTNEYAIDEKAYREKKKAALEDSLKPEEKFDKKEWQRNFLLWYINKELGLSQERMADVFTNKNFKITQSALSRIISKINENMERT